MSSSLCLLRIGEIVFLDEALEALEFGDVLFGRHADKPAGQSRLDQDADLGNVADEILVDRPDPRSAIEGEDDEAFTPQKLKRLANGVRRGAVTPGKVGCDEALIGLQPALDDGVANEMVDGGAFAGGADGIDPSGRPCLEIACLAHSRLPSPTTLDAHFLTLCADIRQIVHDSFELTRNPNSGQCVCHPRDTQQEKARTLRSSAQMPASRAMKNWRSPMTRLILRSAVLRGAVVSAMTVSLTATPVLAAPPVDLSKWSPEYVRSIAGTEEFDTAEACGKVTPLDYKGRLTFWYQGVFEGDPDLLRQYYKDFFETFRKTYPNIQLEEQALTYNDLLDKFRTALLGNAAPMAVRLQILGGTEFAAKGYLEPLKPEDVGYSAEDFWPGAMKAVTWDGVTYGIPTNNETMALIWNADIFKRAGLDPDKPPATWDDVVTYSKQIHDKLGIAGYGLVARKNAGNTPYRFMPQLWGYGGGVFDEADPSPKLDEIRLNSEASKRALQASYDMYVRDKSVPVSALTNQQADNQPLFVAGQLGMMISHPSDYNVMKDLQKKATGADKDKAQTVIDNMRYGLIPTGPDGKRAVVFGGSNIHILKPEYVDGGKVDEPAAKAIICFWTSPEWSLKMAYAGSNPGNLNGFKTKWMKTRLDDIKFLDVTTSMLPYGIPFPALPQAPEIMNIIVPDMLQNALTGAMTVDQAAEDAAKKVKELMGGGGL